MPSPAHALALAVSLAASLSSQQFVADLDSAPDTFYDPFAYYPVSGNGCVYFMADVPECGRELCITDGTISGTRLFQDVFPGAQGSGARPWFAVGSQLLAQDANSLLLTDGTPTGTRRLRTVSPASMRLLGVVGPRFVWAEGVQPPGTGTFLVSSDGTASGTFELGAVDTFVASIARNGRITISANTAAGAAQLFSTDGLTITPIATLPVAARSGFAALGGHDYFLVEDPSSQATLWRTDGTTPGTSFVAALGAHQGLASIATTGTRLFLGAANQIWTSDGTGAGTTSVRSAMGVMPSMTSFGNLVVFPAGTGTSGQYRLWRSDGTSAGTFVLDSTPANYTEFVVAGGSVFCMSRTSLSRIVNTDGTTGGTRVRNLTSAGNDVLAALGNSVIATVAMTSGAYCAFRLDANAAGHVQLTRAARPRSSMILEPTAAIGSNLYFLVSNQGGIRLWRSDGTAAGTQVVTDFPMNLLRFWAYRDELYFEQGNQIMRHNGVAGLPTMAFQPDPNALWVTVLGIVSGEMVVRADLGFFLTDLYRSDGTQGGTMRLGSASFGGDDSFVSLGAAMFWRQRQSNSLLATLVRNDGTPSAVVALRSDVVSMERLGDRLFLNCLVGGVPELHVVTETSPTSLFVATLPFPCTAVRVAGSRLVLFEEGATGRVCATDGSSTITQLTVPVGSVPSFVADDFVYLTSRDASNRPILWRTDGTTAGTGPAIAFTSTEFSNQFSAEPIAAGNRIFLNATDGVTGCEPWISEGTQATTTLLADLVPNGSSSPEWLGVAGEKAYFTAFDPVRGRELWSLDLAAVGAANKQPFGVGCVGSNGVPRFTIDGMPAIGHTLSLRMERGAANALGLWFVGLGPQRLPVGSGCEFLMTTIAWSDWTITDAAGAASTSLVVPTDPAFVGVQLVAQAACLDALAPSGLGLTGTAGMLLVLGG